MTRHWGSLNDDVLTFFFYVLPFLNKRKILISHEFTIRIFFIQLLISLTGKLHCGTKETGVITYQQLNGYELKLKMSHVALTTKLQRSSDGTDGRL